MSHMMIPYFHWHGGDNLLAETWKPTSTGAIAGACVFLFFIALLDRALAGFRGVMEGSWRARALAVLQRQADASKRNSGSEDSREPLTTPRIRKIAPFIAANDLARGGLHVLQATGGYVLMLAVMTFNGVYILVILAGLGVGEIMFGRFSSAGGHGMH